MERLDYEAAAEHFNRSIVMKEHLGMRFRLGRVLRMLGRYETAIEQFDMIDKNASELTTKTPRGYDISHVMIMN